MNKIFWGIVFTLAFILISISAYGEREIAEIRRLIVFYSANCHKCIQVKKELLPDIEKRFKNKIAVEYRDIADIENYKLLLSLRERYNAQLNIVVPVFYLNGHLLNGDDLAKKDLGSFIMESLALPQVEKPDLTSVDLFAHFKTFKPLAIISAGLIDGINPCAFTVIVFFISFLVLQGYRKRELIIVGLSFIFAVFLTYILLGIGLLGFLYYLRGFWLLIRIFNFSIGILSIILGTLALYDFFKFKQTKSTEGLLLKLPAVVKNQIHSLIGMHYRKTKDREGQQESLSMPIFRLVLSAFITGSLVSILEAVCTGQVYLPTITFVFKTTHLKLQALGYLLLYNLMFIIPLLVIFLFALWGVTSEQFANVLKKRLSLIKILMAILFFAFGIFLLWRA